MYHKFRCQVCFTNLEVSKVPQYCPVCRAYIGDQLRFQGGGTGIKEPEYKDEDE